MALCKNQNGVYSAEFLKTDHVIASKAETMVETIAHLDNEYGGAREYAKLIGLSDSELSSIITNIKVADSKQSMLCESISSI